MPWTNGIGLAGLLAALAWTVVSVEPPNDWVAWGEVRRAAVILALFDLVLGFPPMIGTAARHIREWSPTAWAAIVVLCIGPLVTTLL